MPMLSVRVAHRALAPRFLAACIIVLVTAQPFSASGQAQPANVPLAFADPAFQQVWERTDSLVESGQAQRAWLWGPSPGVSTSEPFAQATNGSRTVQYFDKARMELNTAAAPDSAWRVTTGLLVNELVTGRIQTGQNQFVSAAPSTQTVAGDSGIASNPDYADFAMLTTRANNRTGAGVTATLSGRGQVGDDPANGVKVATFITETAHNIPDVFWAYMNRRGPVKDASGQVVQQQLFDWVYLMGYPITEAYWATITIGGKDYSVLIQLFQRRTLTYVPGFPPGWQVQMGNVGRHYYEWRYQTAMSAAGGPAAQPTPMPTLVPATGAYVGISGDQFVYAGQKIKIKGTNYWLSTSPFQRTWADWDGYQIMAELEKAKEMGVNAIRIGIPYDAQDTIDRVWSDEEKMTKVSPWIRDMMTQLLQIASIYGMKVIFVLFEWYDGHPEPGSKDFATNTTYLQGIIAPYANDDRVLAWDIHNEPDFYPEWKAGKQDEVIRWLKNMAATVRSLDSRHPITVGVGDYRDLWYPAADGTTIMSFVDFVAFHTYDAGALSGQISAIKSRTTMPILLEEMGWPTSSGEEAPTPNAVYDEPTQTFLYTSMLNDAKGANIAGVMQWTLYDFTVKFINLVPGRERFFGLVKSDGTFKPAAQVFKNNYPARILPSDTKTYIPLDTSARPNVRP